MKTVKLSALLLFGIIMTCQKLSAQTYSTDFDGNTGSTMTVSPSSGSNGSIVAPSTSTIVNHNYVTPAQTKTTTTSSSSPSVSTMVGGMIMQSMINNLFSSPKPDPAADAAAAAAAAKAAADAAAAKAEQQRIQDAIELAKYNKLMDSYQPLPGSGNTNLTPMSLPTDPPPSSANSLDYIDGESIESIKAGTNDANVVDLSHLKDNTGTVGSLKEIEEEIDYENVEFPEADGNSKSELYKAAEPSETYSPKQPPANTSPEESMTKDVIFYAQSIADYGLGKHVENLLTAIKAETYPDLAKISEVIKLEKLAKISTGVGAAIGVYSFYDDVTSIYKDPNIGMNMNTLYKVSTAVADAGLMVGGIAATSTVIFGAGVVGTPLALTAGTVMLLGKYYVTQNPNIYKNYK